jgi:hypothetical protein
MYKIIHSWFVVIFFMANSQNLEAARSVIPCSCKNGNQIEKCAEAKKCSSNCDCLKGRVCDADGKCGEPQFLHVCTPVSLFSQQQANKYCPTACGRDNWSSKAYIIEDLSMGCMNNNYPDNGASSTCLCDHTPCCQTCSSTYKGCQEGCMDIRGGNACYTICAGQFESCSNECGGGCSFDTKKKTLKVQDASSHSEKKAAHPTSIPSPESK